MRRQTQIREKQEKGEDREPILEKLRAALLRSFKDSTAKKWCVQGECPGQLGPLRRPTAVLTQPKRGRGLHHYVKAALHWCKIFFLAAESYCVPE